MVAKKDELSRISSGKIEILKTQLKEKTKEKQQRKVSKKKKKRQQYKWLKQIYLELEEIKTRLDVLMKIFAVFLRNFLKKQKIKSRQIWF